MARTLQCAFVVPGVPHVDTIHSLVVLDTNRPNVGRILTSDRGTVVLVGLWSSIPFDYLVKLSGADDLRSGTVDHFPAPLAHPATGLIVHRTLRLNCMTRPYASAWRSLYEEGFATDSWSAAFSGILTELRSSRSWTKETPLRSELARRAALVELDALAALALGLTVDQLVLMYNGQFPVLRKYEYYTYFDSTGQRIGINRFPHSRGFEQLKGDYDLLQAYLDGGDCDDLLDRYKPFPIDENHEQPWFYKPDREAEMRAAYAEFEQRLKAT